MIYVLQVKSMMSSGMIGCFGGLGFCFAPVFVLAVPPFVTAKPNVPSVLDSEPAREGGFDVALGFEGFRSTRGWGRSSSDEPISMYSTTFGGALAFEGSLGVGDCGLAVSSVLRGDVWVFVFRGDFVTTFPLSSEPDDLRGKGRAFLVAVVLLALLVASETAVLDEDPESFETAVDDDEEEWGGGQGLFDTNGSSGSSSSESKK